VFLSDGPGRRVKVIYTRSIVRIYAQGEMVAIHPRDYTPGGYSTIPEHLCSTHQHYLKRSPALLYAKGRAGIRATITTYTVSL